MTVAYAATIDARYHGGTGNLPPTRIVIHATVSPCEPGGAVNVAHYFTTAAAGGSAHVVADPGELVRCLPDDIVAYQSPPNPHSLGIELCDWSAGDPARWSDPAHTAMLGLAAGQVREWCDRYRIPVVWLSPSDLVAGRHGITSHANVSAAWRETNHTDPGPGFPHDHFLALAAGTGDDDMTPEQAKMLQEVHDAIYKDPKAFGLSPMWSTMSQVGRDTHSILDRVNRMFAQNWQGGDLSWLDKRLASIAAKKPAKKKS